MCQPILGDVVTGEDPAAQRPSDADSDSEPKIQLAKSDSPRGVRPDLSTAKEPAPMLEAHALSGHSRVPGLAPYEAAQENGTIALR